MENDKSTAGAPPVQESEQRLRAIFDAADKYTVLLTPDGRLVEVNRALLEFTGSAREEVLGQPFWLNPWFAGTEAAAELVHKAVRRAAEGESLRHELRVRGPSNDSAMFDLSFRPVRNESGEVVFLVAEGCNITDLKAVELRNALLVRLDDSTRPLNDAQSIVASAMQLLREYLGADRCMYGEAGQDQETLTIEGNRYGLIQFGEKVAESMRANQPFTAADVPNDPRLHDALTFYRDAQIGAFCGTPLHKGGQLAAIVGVGQEAPREWLTEEVELVQRVANRCWESIERARVTRELEISERRLRLAHKAGRIGSFEWFIDEDRITWSVEMEMLYGLPEGAFEGRLQDWEKRVIAEDAKRVIEGIKSCLGEREAEYSYEFRAVLPDGAVRWLLGHAQFSYNEAGAPHRMIGVNIDIDAQKQAEAHLRQQWHNFDAALSNSPDFTYTLDLSGRFTYANRALLSLLQIPLSGILGKNYFDLGYPVELAGKLQLQIEQVIQSKDSVRDETPFSGPTGEIRHYEYILAPVLAANGDVEAVAGSTRDITARKQAEEQEREMEEQLRESARLESLGVMAGGIAHDFNNLLTGILGNACLLAEQVPDEDGAIAGQIVLAAERAADLTRQMLAFSGKGRFVVESVDVNALVQENLTLLRASLSRTATVELDLTDHICIVEADRSQLQQVVMNLLINASEAMADQPGKVKIRSAITERVVKLFSPFLQTAVLPGRYVVLEISDTGCGMNPETLKKIFDPFFTTKFTGRGLGLAAVLGILKGHQGDIEVITQAGAGTTFRVLLPLAELAGALPSETDTEHETSTRGQTILVVDDEEIVRKIATTALSRAGFQVIAATHGVEALDQLRGNSDIALVILDLTMPVMTGEQAIPLIQELRPDLPIILSSGFNEAEIAHRFAAAGIAGFLQKPYGVSAILAKVAELLRAALAAKRL